MSERTRTQPRRPLRIHIGSHFFGSGNIGDDWMLAGFLRAAESESVQLTCATPLNLATQRLRFPQVTWLEYRPDLRRQAVQNCDVWLGLGDSPFQSDLGDWFVDHLVEETGFCESAGKPMDYLGVGVMNRDDLRNPKLERVLQRVRRIWTRESESAHLMGEIISPERVTAGADLSHLYFRSAGVPAIERGVVGITAGFEHSSAGLTETLSRLVDGLSEFQMRWLVQEVRDLPGSERDLFQKLPPKIRERLDVRIPGYDTDSIDGLIGSWGSPEFIVTSRFHAAIEGAWRGAKVLCIERSEKVRALAKQMGLASVSIDAPAERMVSEMRNARVASRATCLREAALAEFCCSRFFACAGS